MSWLQRQTLTSSWNASRTTTVESVTVVQYGWSILGSKEYHEQHSHLYVGISRFFTAKNVLIMICENGRRSSVANAVLWSSTLSRYGRYLHSVSLIHLSERDFFLERHVRRKVFGMQQAVFQSFSNTQRLRSCRMFTTCCSNGLGESIGSDPRPES